MVDLQKVLKVGRILLSIIAVIVFAYGMINFMIASLQSVRDYKKEISQGKVTSSGIVVYEEERAKGPISDDSSSRFYGLLGFAGGVLFVLVNIGAIILFVAEKKRQNNHTEKINVPNDKKERYIFSPFNGASRNWDRRHDRNLYWRFLEKHGLGKR